MVEGEWNEKVHRKSRHVFVNSHCNDLSFLLKHKNCTMYNGMTRKFDYINDLPGDVICNIDIYADDTTLYSNWDQASDMW